jgi:integrase
MFLYTQKGGTPVHLPLPPELASRLRLLTIDNAKYFFWTGASSRSTVTGNWRADITQAFRSAGIPNGGPHRLRDTFAVSLLQRGVSIENVQVLLGHKSLRITEKHYSPWVQTRQDALEAAVKGIWSESKSKLP